MAKNHGFGQKHDGKQEKIEEEDLSQYKGSLEVFVNFKFSNGEVWQVPAKFIAANRARDISNDDKDTTFVDEFTYAMKEDYELTDWAQNNMNWSDLRPHAKLLPAESEEFNYDAEFCNVETDVVRHN